MKPTIPFCLALLLVSSVAAQVSAPQVPVTGGVGPQGNFPLFNHGTIMMTADTDYNMQYPETSATVLQIISTVSLGATRNVIMPSNTMGFLYTVQNATTGGRAIVFKGQTGTGVTIPNGQAMLIMSDGTNYVSAGSAGAGTVTTFTAGALSPLFTSSVATPTTTPALTFTLSSAAANTVFGNFGSTTAAPKYNTIGACGDSTHALAFTVGTGFTCQAITATGTAGGFGYVVPTQYSSISAALSAASSANSGPVVVLPNSTDKSAFTNTNQRIQNYTQNWAGADGLFFRDVSEWGTIDGTVLTCNTTASSNVITCNPPVGGFISAPAPAGDVGKLIVVNGAGAGTYGQIDPGTSMSVGSSPGLTPGTPNSYQPVTFTDSTDGCTDINSMPYGHVHLGANGLPTGVVDFPNFWGKGCTHVPTQGTVKTVGGTVNFTGGAMAHGDLVAKVTAVNAATNQLTLDTAATYSYNGLNAYYGSDAHDAFQNACNNISVGNFTKGGTLTFSGIALISHGIDCNAAGFRLLGRTQHGMDSAIVYAGKTPNPNPATMTGNVTYPTSYILGLNYGGGAKVERLHLLGNTQAMPMGISLNFGNSCNGDGSVPAGYPYCGTAPGNGNFIGQGNVIDQVDFGAFWGDPLRDLYTPRLQSCVFMAGWSGNSDFTSIDRVYCVGADVGMDSVNNQATGIKIGKWQSQFSNIGISFSGYTEFDSYYTEFNRADFFMGSPYWPGGVPNWGVYFHDYGGESSAMGLGGSNYTAYNIRCDLCGLGGDQGTYGRPDGVSDDFVNQQHLAGDIKWYGSMRGYVLIPYFTQGGPDLKFLGAFESSQFKFPAGSGPDWSTAGWGGNTQLTITGPATNMQVPSNFGDALPTTTPTPGSPLSSMVAPSLLTSDAKSQIITGSLSVRPANWGSVGWGNAVYAYCPANNGSWYPGTLPDGTTPTVPCGSTTIYHYVVTCSDSLGNESLPAPDYGGNYMEQANAATLNSSTNYNYVLVKARVGCATYNFYGDNGSGAIGFLTSVPIEQMIGLYVSNQGLYDYGNFTKDTSRVPPTTSAMGSISAAGNLTVGGNTTLNNVTINGTCSGTGCSTGGPGGGTPTYPLTVAGIVNSGGIPYFSSDTTQSSGPVIATNQVVVGGNPPSGSNGLSFAVSANAELTVGFPGIGNGVLSLIPTGSQKISFTPAANGTTVTIGGTAFTSLLLPAGAVNAVSVGNVANTGMYFGGNAVNFSANGSAAFQITTLAARCLFNGCVWGGNLNVQAQTFQSGIDGNVAGVTTGAALFKSAGFTGGAVSGGSTGNATLQSGDNGATGGASQSVGNAILTSGGFTGASGATAAWSPGYTIIQQKYWVDNPPPLVGNLACYTTVGTANQMPRVSSCQATTDVPWIGVVLVITGQSVSVVKQGHVSVNSNAAMADPAGSFACLDTVAAGKVVIQATACPAGQGVGIVDMTGSGTTSHSVDVERN